MLDVRFIPLGKTYLPELSRVYAAAWNEGAKALESGQPVTATLKGCRAVIRKGTEPPRIRPTGHRGAQERGPVLGFRPGPVLPSMGQQESMQPETVASCLVATEHRSILRQAESSLGSLDLQDQAQSAAGGDRLEPGLLAQPDGEGQLPIAGRPGPSR